MSRRRNTFGGKHYIQSGERMWITNAEFADLFTLLAKIDIAADCSTLQLFSDNRWGRSSRRGSPAAI
jgi:alkylation response protein AidB-like acyl-CoA dehydrogenase